MSKELEHINKQLKRIERESQSLEDRISNLSDQETALRQRYAELRYKVKVGSIVRRKGAEYCVTGVDTSWHPDRPWLQGSPKRKNGTFGKAHRRLYSDWEVVTAHGEE